MDAFSKLTMIEINNKSTLFEFKKLQNIFEIFQACSTCHLIFKPEDYAKLGEPPTDEELDMLVSKPQIFESDLVIHDIVNPYVKV